MSAMEPTIQDAEIRRANRKPTENLQAYDLYMRALTPYYTMTRKGVDDAHALLRSAIQDDPDYSYAKAFVAALCVIKKSLHYQDELNQAVGRNRGFRDQGGDAKTVVVTSLRLWRHTLSHCQNGAVRTLL